MEILIAGGGVAALEALLTLRDLAGERVDVKLIAPERRTDGQPLAVSASGAEASLGFELGPILCDLDAELHEGALAEVRARTRQAVTRKGEVFDYDALLVAVGARSGVGLPGAIPARGPHLTEEMDLALDQLGNGRASKLVFAVPSGAGWALPLYELALLTSRAVAARGLVLELALVTPERHPLELFGEDVSQGMRRLLEGHAIELHTGRQPASVADDGLVLVPNYRQRLRADRIVSPPRRIGPGLRGLPADREGFVPTDTKAAVPALPGVFAAGDATALPVKNGGIAAQQARAAAEAIAAQAGVEVDPQPFRPRLRGTFFTRGQGVSQEAGESTLWWPPSKAAAPRLREYLGVEHRDFAEDDAVHVDVDLGGSSGRLGV